ncbi:conserved domain protein, partial [Bacteroides xylanisolvens SD CC 2a]
MKKILFILFATQFILAPYIIKSYGANLIEDNYEYSGVNQGRKTVEKDIFGNIIIRDDKGNRKTIEKDIFGNITIRDDKGNRKTIEEDYTLEILPFVMIRAIERLLKKIFLGIS